MIGLKKKISLLCILLFSVLCLSAQNYYWEEPEEITDYDTRFPLALSAPVNPESDSRNDKGKNQDKVSIIFWEEVDLKHERLYISARTTTDGFNWKESKRFAGPINYKGEIPEVYTAAINSKGSIAVAALTDKKEITVYLSEDNKGGFRKTQIPNIKAPFVAPRIYAASNNRFVLFASQGDGDKFTLWYSVSDTGGKWSEFKPFTASENQMNPFLPFLIKTDTCDLVVFQAQYASATKLTYQLYSTFSTDGMKNWSEPVMITDQSSMGLASTTAFNQVNNQRPYLHYDGEKNYIAWERSRQNSDSANIWFSELDEKGHIKGNAEQISRNSSATRPVIFSYLNSLNLLWYDNRSGTERIYLAQKQGSFWDESALSTKDVSSVAANPLITNKGQSLSFIWQNNDKSENMNNRIVLLTRDHTVLPPVITPLTFQDGLRNPNPNPVARIAMTEDSSGVAGYSYIWTRNAEDEPPKELMCKPSEQDMFGKADEDGLYYFKARQLDFAGNWSDSTMVTFNLDHTPPAVPRVASLDLDEYGFPSSNSFKIQWEQGAEDSDFAGFRYSVQYIASMPKELIRSRNREFTLTAEEVQTLLDSVLETKQELLNKDPLESVRNLSQNTSIQYWNQRNGIYKFTIAAYDDIGNVSEPVTMLLPLNKYIPVTYITTVNAVSNEMEEILITLYGGGFTYDGKIETIYVDRDGKAPYDYTYNAADGDFTVDSDNRISGIKLVDLDEGDYKVGLVHPDRGIYFTGNLIKVVQNGTVKIQNTYTFSPNWAPVASGKKYNVNVGTLLLIIVFVFALVGFIAALRGLSSTAKEAVIVRREVTALITGDVMPQEKKKKTEVLKKKGVSLKVKLAGFSVALVVTIVLMVSIPLGYIMTRIQDRTLSSGLHDRVTVLLDSLSTGAKAYLPLQDILQLSYLPDQIEALPEAQYATLTGISSTRDDEEINHIWATNDPAITQKTESGNLVLGQTPINDEIISQILDNAAQLNREAANELSQVTYSLSQLNSEGSALALNTDEESLARLEEIEIITTELNTRVNTILSELASRGTGSYPEYDSSIVDRDNTTYLFYKPVLYRQSTDSSFVHGIILVEVKTDSLIKSSFIAQKTIIYTSLIIAVIAMLLGVLGSLLLASVIIKPIRILSNHVAMIRDTDDKELLAGKDLKIRRNDEIGLLGDTVNEMTHGLVQAAKVSKNLVVGKDIQTKFIPLQIDKNGNTLTTGTLSAKGADFFSYYAGADELSGDYFDYKQLDDHHYAVIKCDVSGHGVPAALIMVEVATLFLNYFNDWNIENPYQGFKIAPVVEKINDLLESRGFKGRFAAFTLCIIDTLSGEAWFCNAGDNMVHIYDGTTHKKKVIALQETPAAGMFSSDLIQMKGGYKVSKITLKKDDILFLYTDGIEEAKRNFRDEKFNIMECAEPGLEKGEDHLNHKVGESSEEMSPERVKAIIECVYAKRKYVLEKQHNPVSGEVFVFDFSTCEGTAEDAVIALVSIEKIFRMYKPVENASANKIKVDRKIDTFLKLHFQQYSTYCSDRSETSSSDPFIYYHGVCEDPQYDDLTLIAIKKN